MILRFCSGSATPFRLVRNRSLGVDADHLDAHVAGEGAHDLVALVEAQQAVVDEDAVSWSPMARCSSAATTEESTPPDKPEQDLVVADLLADLARCCPR